MSLSKILHHLSLKSQLGLKSRCFMPKIHLKKIRPPTSSPGTPRGALLGTTRRRSFRTSARRRSTFSGADSSSTGCGGAAGGASTSKNQWLGGLPSGKHTKRHGKPWKITIFGARSTINCDVFNLCWIPGYVRTGLIIPWGYNWLISGKGP